MRTIAPSRSPFELNSIFPELVFCKALMSMTRAGRITSSFMRSSRVVPPARYWFGELLVLTSSARPPPVLALSAALTSSTRANWKGRMAGLFHFRSSLLDGVHDVRIGGATAQISAHVFANLGVDAGMAFFHAGDCRQDLARSAIAALERVVVDKGLLHRVQAPVGLRQPFDGGDILTIGAGCQCQAGQHPAVVDQYSAGTALAVIAAFFASGQAHVLAQRVQQRGADVKRETMSPSVDLQRDVDWVARIGLNRRGRGFSSRPPQKCD